MNGDKTLTANFQQQQQAPTTKATFVDSRDGKSYSKVTIGDQTWMAENLNYNASGSVCFNNNSSNCAQYGRLYSWSTAMNGASSSSANPSGVQGVCPAGWHLPSNAEWATLENYVGSSSGTKLKSTSGWDNNGNGTDQYGFSALPGGDQHSDGSFNHGGQTGLWWSTNEYSSSNAYSHNIYSNETSVKLDNYSKYAMYSVRCVEGQSFITYTVTFNSNGGNGTTPNALTADAGYSLTLPSGSGLSRNGYTFGGWNTNSSGTGSTYSAGSNYTPSGNVTLYAKWDAVYTVTFSVNGGSGTEPSVQTVNAGTSITLPSDGGLSRNGYTFGGWSTNSSGTGSIYNVSTSYTPNSNITLYAKWDWIGKGNDINKYRTVAIGTQVWMAENLDYNVEGSKCYNNSADSCAKYGRLYNWGTAMGLEGSYYGTVWGGSDVNHRGVCPVGWHIPSDAEWSTLVSYVGGSSTAGTKLKATSGWYNAYSYSNGTDDYGFSALPGGYGGSGGNFLTAGYLGLWWSSTENVA
jgi:uncharacterized protein (TIGR02145 family)/uncharacterized repeat protein (TIGR02543 family)